MKLVTIEEFLKIQGNVIFAPFHGNKDDGVTRMDLGELEVRFEMLNDTNWYSYFLGGDDLQTISGVDSDERLGIENMMDGKGNSVDYDPAGTRQYLSLYEDGQRFLVLEPHDVELMIHRLIENFPSEAKEAFNKTKI